MLDYKFFKRDMKVAISLGYICDECKSRIITVLGQDTAACIDKVSARDWIGEVDEAGSVAYDLKKFFKVNLNKDTGFTKTFWEKAKESLPELPKVSDSHNCDGYHHVSRYSSKFIVRIKA